MKARSMVSCRLAALLRCVEHSGVITSLVQTGSRSPVSDLVLTEQERETVLRYLQEISLLPGEKTVLEGLWARQEQWDVWLRIVIPAQGIWVYTVVHPRTKAVHLRVLSGRPGGGGRCDSRPGVEAADGSRVTTRVLAFHRAFPVTVSARGAFVQKPEPAEVRESQDSANERRLGGILAEIIEEAGLTIVDSVERTTKSDAARLAIEVVNNYELSSGVPVEKWFCCPLRAADLSRLHRQILDARPAWPSTGRPYAMAVVVARSVSTNSVSVAGRGAPWTFAIAGQLSIYGAADIGPYLVLATIAENAEVRGTCAFLRAYAHPIVSDNCWLLIDSRHERRVALWLIAWVQACRAQGLPVILRKPAVVAEYHHDGAVVRIRPDFALDFENYAFPLFIEVIGRSDEPYLGTKKDHAAVLRARGEYCEVNAVAAELCLNDAGWHDQEDRLRFAFARWLARARRAPGNFFP